MQRFQREAAVDDGSWRERQELAHELGAAMPNRSRASL